MALQNLYSDGLNRAMIDWLKKNHTGTIATTSKLGHVKIGPEIISKTKQEKGMVAPAYHTHPEMADATGNWKNPITMTLTGDVTGAATFDGSGDFKVETVVVNSNSDEVIDARTGYDDTEYESLGEAIRSQIADIYDLIMYVEMSIESFSSTTPYVENGMLLRRVVLNYTFNKTPTSLMLNGLLIDPDKTQTVYENISIQNTTTYTLVATDEKGATSTRSTTIRFCNGLYYGAFPVDVYDNAFITKMTKVLSASKSTKFTITAGVGQFIYFCCPVSYGECKFNVHGFDGGFRKVATISYINSNQYTENYDIYKSDNENLGEQTVTVS